MEPIANLQDLFKRYLNNACTAEEVAQLLRYFGSAEEVDLRTLIQQALEEPVSVVDREAHLAKLFINIKKKTTARKLANWYWASAAAMFLIACSITFILLRNDESIQQQTQVKAPQADIAPGGNKATLTLADGTTITLDDAKNGEIAEQIGISITKTADGQIVYTASGSAATSSSSGPTYNIIETPIGGQYQINLPDGTKVWLNAESSLKYPTQFAANERRVELRGEGYFEVAKKNEGKRIPFIVKTATQTVEVLGTHFNINSYANEDFTKTTLLEGSVRVIKQGNSKLLSPGEQSVLSPNSFTIENVDVEKEIAWKNGNFYFNEDIESIMKKLARWYDIDVEYRIEKDPNLMFGGKISRSKNISAVLSIIEATGNVHFKVEGRRVTVMK